MKTTSNRSGIHLLVPFNEKLLIYPFVFFDHAFNDEEGEVYVTTSAQIGPQGNTGKVYKIIKVE